MPECAKVVFGHGMEKRLKAHLHRTVTLGSRHVQRVSHGTRAGGMATFFSSLSVSPVVHQGIWVGVKGGGEDFEKSLM